MMPSSHNTNRMRKIVQSILLPRKLPASVTNASKDRYQRCAVNSVGTIDSVLRSSSYTQAGVSEATRLWKIFPASVSPLAALFH